MEGNIEPPGDTDDNVTHDNSLHNYMHLFLLLRGGGSGGVQHHITDM